MLAGARTRRGERWDRDHQDALDVGQHPSLWSSVSDLCKLSSCRYQSEQNRRHPADERLEERRKKIAELRRKLIASETEEGEEEDEAMGGGASSAPTREDLLEMTA